MHPFYSLFTEEPEIEYVPDIFGRVGQGGTVVKPDPEPIGTPNPRFDEFIKAERRGDGLTDLFGVDDPLGIKGPVGPTGPNRRADVGKVETSSAGPATTISARPMDRRVIMVCGWKTRSTPSRSATGSNPTA